MPGWQAVPDEPVPAEELVPAATVAAPVVAAPVPAPAGGQRFGAATAVSAPVGPPGVRAPYGAMPAMQPAGTFTPTHAPRPRKARKRLTMLAVLAILGGAAFVAYPHVMANGDSDKAPKANVANNLSTYVGGKGFDYAPAGRGFTVRLPDSPTVTSRPPDPGDRSTTEAHSSGLGFDVAVTEHVIRVTPRDPTPLVLIALATEVERARVRSGAQSTTFRGNPAAETSVTVPGGRTARYLAVSVGHQIFVFRATSTRNTDALFGALTKSFRLT